VIYQPGIGFAHSSRAVSGTVTVLDAVHRRIFPHRQQLQKHSDRVRAEDPCGNQNAAPRRPRTSSKALCRRQVPYCREEHPRPTAASGSGQRGGLPAGAVLDHLFLPRGRPTSQEIPLALCSCGLRPRRGNLFRHLVMPLLKAVLCLHELASKRQSGRLSSLNIVSHPPHLLHVLLALIKKLGPRISGLCACHHRAFRGLPRLVSELTAHVQQLRPCIVSVRTRRVNIRLRPQLTLGASVRLVKFVALRRRLGGCRRLHGLSLPLPLAAWSLR